MKKIIYAFVFLFVLPVIAYSEDDTCNVYFQVDNGKQYEMKSISDFIKAEVRPVTTRDQKTFTVTMEKKCSNKDNDSVVLDMNANNLYIHGIDGNTLPDNIVKYTDDPLTISKKSFLEKLNGAIEFNKLTFKEKQSTLKMFAFVIAESARFEDVNNTVEDAFLTGCTYQWNDFSHLLRRWKTLSIFANSQGIVGKDPYTGGTRAFLIVPITSDIVKEYNKDVVNGWKVVIGSYGKPRVSDKPIELPVIGCKN